MNKIFVAIGGQSTSSNIPLYFNLNTFFSDRSDHATPHRMKCSYYHVTTYSYSGLPRMGSSTSTTSSSPLLLVSYVTKLDEGPSSQPQQLVRLQFNLMCTLTLINDDPLFLFGPIPVFPTTGMFVFWTLQTVCFALYSEHGDIKAAHTFIAMICKPPSIP